MQIKYFSSLLLFCKFRKIFHPTFLMISIIRKYWQNNTFSAIMIIAIILRLLAAIFSKGYAMSDDHFVVIHVAQRWVDGFNDWFNKDHPSGFSLVYTGFHYLLFYGLKLINITDPTIKMYIVRLIHASYSLLIVYFGYKIALKISNKEIAANVGLLLAAFWLLPFMGVLNLNEMVCVPPMMAGFYFIMSGMQTEHKKYWIYAGILFGLAFAIRYQTILIPGGIGLVLLLQKEWKYFIQFTLGTMAGLFVLQGLVDWIFWGYPFAAFIQYLFYNIDARYDYIVGPWYKYILLILGILIPPVSLALIYGYLKTMKNYAILFWPVMIFLIFHSLFPNKQERFILPILPMLLILGTIGWNSYIKDSSYWKSKQKILKISNAWFWSINSILLVVLIFTFSKKTLVEPMIYLSEKQDVRAVIIEYDKHNMPWFPRFYMERKVPIYRLSKDYSTEKFIAKINALEDKTPNYVFFFGLENIQTRILNLEKLLDIGLEFEKQINPSLVDYIMHKLNPKHNLNLTSYIYKVISKEEN